MKRRSIPSATEYFRIVKGLSSLQINVSGRPFAFADIENSLLTRQVIVPIATAGHHELGLDSHELQPAFVIDGPDNSIDCLSHGESVFR